MRILAATAIRLSLIPAFSTLAVADNYPVSGAWARLDKTAPKSALESCLSYNRDTKNVVGNVIVFNGRQKREFNGGYLEDETVANISVKRIGPNEFKLVDRYYEDGEDGTSSGYRKRSYRMVIGDDQLSIAEGNSGPSVYASCAKLASAQVQRPKNEASSASKPAVISAAEQTSQVEARSRVESSSTTWPLGPIFATESSSIQEIIEKLGNSEGKRDLFGLSPGMTYKDALSVLSTVRDVERKDGRCEVFAFAPEVVAEFEKRGDRLTCATKDGRLSISFSPNLSPRRIASVSMDFPSGASPDEMVKYVTERYGGSPSDITPMVNCGAMRNNGIGFSVPAYSKANGEYDECLRRNHQAKLRIVTWLLNNGLALKLERQERYYDQTSNFGFTITLESPAIQSAERLASQTNAQMLNSHPELTTSRVDLIGIRPGMSYAQVLELIKSQGYYIRQLSNPVALDRSGQPLPHCDDPDENSDNRGTRLRCSQSKDRNFNLRFEFAGAFAPPVISSIELNFESGLDQMIEYSSGQFGAQPAKRHGYAGLKTASWSLPGHLTLDLEQERGGRWSFRLTDRSIVESSRKRMEDAQRERNTRPPF